MKRPLGRLRDLVGENSQVNVLAAYKQLKKGAAPDFAGVGPLDELTVSNHNIPTVAVSGLIVELREHWNLIHVLKRFMRHLKIPVTLVYGKRNKSFVESSSFVRREVLRGRLRLIQLSLENINRPQYTALFLTENLWRSVFPAEQVLVFQTDSTVCPRSPYPLESFRDIDFVGSFMPNPRPSGLHIDGGNGGLSLRSLSKTFEAIRGGDPENWPSPEDDYFGAHIQLVGGKVADEATSKKFGTQVSFEFKSFGVHNPGGLGPWPFLKLLAYCPDALRCHRGTLLGRSVPFYLSPILSRFKGTQKAV